MKLKNMHQFPASYILTLGRAKTENIKRKYSHPKIYK